MQTASPRAARAIRENGGRADAWVRFSTRRGDLDVQVVESLGESLQEQDGVLLFNNTLLRVVERDGVPLLDLA